MFRVVSDYQFDVYIITTLIFWSLSIWIGTRLAQVQQRIIIIDFKTLLVIEIATLFQFLAFSALIGRIPYTLVVTSILVGVFGWLFQIWLLRLTASPKGNDYTVIRQIIIADRLLIISGLGLLSILGSIGLIGFQVWAAFLYDPAQMGTPYYQAKIALYILVLPSLFSIILIQVPMQIILMASRYSPPALRNLALVNAVTAVLMGITLVVGPLYAYAPGFGALLGIELPSLSVLIAMIGSGFGVLFIGAYFIGYRAHKTLGVTLQKARIELMQRGIAILSWRGGRYKDEQCDVFIDRLLAEWNKLVGNELLVFIGATLLITILKSSAGEQYALRANALRRMGFNDPLLELTRLQEAIKRSPKFLWNREFFEDIQARGALPGASDHPLLKHFEKVATIFLLWLDADPDFAYRCGDWLELETKEQMSNNAPAYVVSAFTFMAPFFYRLYELDWSRLLTLLGSIGSRAH